MSGKKIEKTNQAIKGRYRIAENCFSSDATRFAKRTIISTPRITIILTNHVVPKYNEMAVILFVSKRRNPAPRKKKWRSSPLPFLSELRKRKSRETPKRNPIVTK